MRSRLEAPRANITFWTPTRIIFSTIIMSLLIACGYCTVYSVMSLFFKPVAVFPTSIPWIHSESECKHTNRTWQDGKCWDYEHDMTF